MESEGTQLVGTGEVGDTSTLPKADAYVCMYNNNAYCFLPCKVENEGNNVRNKSGGIFFFLASDSGACTLCPLLYFTAKFYCDRCTILAPEVQHSEGKRAQ